MCMCVCVCDWWVYRVRKASSKPRCPKSTVPATISANTHTHTRTHTHSHWLCSLLCVDKQWSCVVSEVYPQLDTEQERERLIQWKTYILTLREEKEGRARESEAKEREKGAYDVISKWIFTAQCEIFTCCFTVWNTHTLTHAAHWLPGAAFVYIYSWFFSWFPNLSY